MSDRSTTPVNRDVPERVKRPRLAHDQTIALIQTIIDNRVQSRLPTMGTVIGMDGVRPIIAIDGETTAPRTVGFPAKQGQEYAVGMRVSLVKTLSGHFHVAGSVGGRADVVNTAQVRNAAINNDKIGSDVSGRITSAQSKADQGVTNAATAQTAAQTAQTAAQTAQTAAQTAQTRADTVGVRADAAYTLAANAATSAQLSAGLATKADAGHTHGQYADNNAYQATKGAVRCIRMACNCAAACGE